MSRTSYRVMRVVAVFGMLAVVGDLSKAAKKTPPAPELPNVRYRIKYVPFPQSANTIHPSASAITSPFLLNGTWRVKAVGDYLHSDGRYKAYLYDPEIDPQVTVDLNSWFFDASGVPRNLQSLPASYPPGYYLSHARDINDWGVVVGHLDDDLGNRRGFAIDLTIEPPVLDLLPTNGSANSWVRKINENGDILVAYENASGSWGSFLFNPGYYGAPITRLLRDGAPFDFSNETELLTLNLDGDPRSVFLNNPSQVRPAQIVGETADGYPYRYTIGMGSEIFTFPVIGVSALNDDGAFCGEAKIPLNKSNYKTDPFRYRFDSEIGDWAFELVSIGGATNLTRYPHDMNSDLDLLTRYDIYREGWGGWLSVRDLLVADTPDDLSLWGYGFLLWPYLSERVPVTDRQGNIVNAAGIIVGGQTNIDNVLVILTPEFYAQ